MKPVALAALCVVALLFAPAAARAGTEDEAGDVSEVDKDALGPLRERVRPVSGHLFRKAKRVELSPAIGLSVRDAFFTKYTFGASLNYHFAETFGLGLRFAYALPVVSNAAQICSTGANGSILGCKSPDYVQVDGKAPGQINLLAGLDFQWSPIYGKVAVVSEGFLHFDMYALAGPSLVMYGGPGTNGSVTATTVGGNVGLGMRFTVNRFITVRTEARDLIYVENTDNVKTPTSLRNQFLLELGLSFFLPTVFGEG